MSTVQLGANWKTGTFTATEADTMGKGRIHKEITAQGVKLWKLVKNTSATAITAGMVSKITSYAANEIQPNAVLAGQNFGGQRALGADSLTQNLWGYVQILGYSADGIFGDTATAIQASKGVVMDDATGGGRVGGVIDTVDLTGSDAADKTAVEAALGSAAGVFAIAVAVSAGVADEAVIMTIIRNGWGQYCAND